MMIRNGRLVGHGGLDLGVADTAEIERRCAVHLVQFLPDLIGAAVKACHANDYDSIEAAKAELRSILEQAGVVV